MIPGQQSATRLMPLRSPIVVQYARSYDQLAIVRRTALSYNCLIASVPHAARLMSMNEDPPSSISTSPISPANTLLVVLACLGFPAWLFFKMFTSAMAPRIQVSSAAIAPREFTIRVDLLHNRIANRDAPYYEVEEASRLVLDATKYNWHWSDLVPKDAPQPNAIQVVVGDAEYRMDWRPLVIRETIQRSALRKLRGKTEFEMFYHGWTFFIAVGYQPTKDSEDFFPHWGCRAYVLPLGKRVTAPSRITEDRMLIWPDSSPPSGFSPQASGAPSWGSR